MYGDTWLLGGVVAFCSLSWCLLNTKTRLGFRLSLLLQFFITAFLVCAALVLRRIRSFNAKLNVVDAGTPGLSREALETALKITNNDAGGAIMVIELVRKEQYTAISAIADRCGGWGTPTLISVLRQLVLESDLEWSQSNNNQNRAAPTKRRRRIASATEPKHVTEITPLFRPELVWEGTPDQIVSCSALNQETIPRLDLILSQLFDRYSEELDGNGIITTPKHLEMLLTNLVVTLGLKGPVSDIQARMREIDISPDHPWDAQTFRQWLAGQVDAG